MTILKPVNQDWRHPSNIETKKGRKNKINKTKFLKILFLLGLTGVGVLGIISLGMIAWVSRDLPNPNGLIDRQLTTSTKIFDNTGETVLYDVHGDIKRTVINLDQIPEHSRHATLAAEDRDFYNHRGFSLTGIARSVLKNIFTGSKVGGSTLTQQLVKNAILTNEKTYTRKIKELILAYQIEKKFTKDEILQMYFNEIPYGSVIYGIEAASQSFFGKSAKDLTIAESAILAALPQAPTFYSPYGNNRDKLMIRQRYVIDSMVDLGYISNEQADQAKQEKITFKPFKESITAPHFVMYIRQLLSEKYGEDFITQEGLKVYTTLDIDKQKIAEKAVKDGVDKNGAKYGFTNSALVSVDPRNGHIIAMVGSVDYFNDDIDGQVNVTVRPRQPGSSFKPIVYTAAFIKGYTPSTVLYDVVTNFGTGGQSYEPKNYDLGERGPITIRQALAGSLNIPAVKTTYLTGVDKIVELAQKLGYTTLNDKDRFGLSIVLGGGEVLPLEHAGAYSALAQDGTRHPIIPITRIEDARGKVIFEAKDEPEDVIEPEIVRQTNSIMTDDSARAYVFGAGGPLTLPGRPVAAKTGTTNDYHDAWTVGYTPSLVAVVWVGNNDNTEMKRGADGSIIAAPIWNQYMREALANTPVESFPVPANIPTGKAILDGSLHGEQKIIIDEMSGKLATEYTPEETRKEIIIKDLHSILYYVNKDNPRGDQPSNPEQDPQFTIWEEAIKRWAEKNNINPNQDITIPTEYDDIHYLEDKPQIQITNIKSNQIINTSNITVDIKASAKRGIKTVKYFIDDQLITTKNSVGKIDLPLSGVDNGYHQLIIKVYDDLSNSASDSKEININIPNNNPPTLIWNLNQNTEISTFPFNLSGKLTSDKELDKVDIYVIDNENKDIYIGSISNPIPDVKLTWQNKVNPGNYTLYANIFDLNNRKYTSEKVSIIVK